MIFAALLLNSKGTDNMNQHWQGWRESNTEPDPPVIAQIIGTLATALVLYFFFFVLFSL